MDLPGAAALRATLGEARDLGFLGPGDLDDQLAHAAGFAAAVGNAPRRFLDLGSGGGLPGLVLATVWPTSHGLLLDASARRVAFLDRACARLGFGARIVTLQERAETAARRPELRGAFDLVTARGFGPPAVTAECAVGFLEAHGRLAVSEPPDPDPDRWPPAGLGELGFGEAEPRRSGPAAVVVIPSTGPAGARWPRRTGIPAKRPLWG